MRLFYIVLLICCNQLLFGQNGGKINGIVHNTDNQILPKATVSIIDQVDSTVISYTLSDDHGRFNSLDYHPIKSSFYLYHILVVMFFPKTLNFQKMKIKTLG